MRVHAYSCGEHCLHGFHDAQFPTHDDREADHLNNHEQDGKRGPPVGDHGIDYKSGAARTSTPRHAHEPSDDVVARGNGEDHERKQHGQEDASKGLPENSLLQVEVVERSAVRNKPGFLTSHPACD